MEGEPGGRGEGGKRSRPLEVVTNPRHQGVFPYAIPILGDL